MKFLATPTEKDPIEGTPHSGKALKNYLNSGSYFCIESQRFYNTSQNICISSVPKAKASVKIHTFMLPSSKSVTL